MKNSTDKYQILFLVPLPPPVHGSAVMSQQIMNSSVIRSSFVCDFVNISTSRSISEVSHFTAVKPLRYLIILVRVLAKLLINKYDACYIALTCHGKGFLKDAPLALLCKVFGNKLIIHQHNKGMSSCIGLYPYRWLIPLVYKNASVILLSWRLYPDIESVVSRDQVHICPNGIPDTSVTAGTERHDAPHILFLSNLIKSKGVFELLEACSILKKKGLEFVCDYVGNETFEISTKLFDDELRFRDLSDNVLYHGAIYGEEKERMWLTANIFIFPTYYEDEAFPVVILEAMHHRLPVVSTDEGGIPDIVADGITGFIVQKHDVMALADRIEWLLNNPDIAKLMGKAGRKRLEEKFTVAAWEECLKECIEKSIENR